MNAWATALIPAVSAILGATISGVLTYRAARIGFDSRRQRVRLLRSLLDLEFFLALEQEYLEQRAGQTDTPAQTTKVAMRAKVRDSLGRVPSDASEPARLQKMIAALKMDLPA